jgi:HEAT repeat protein
MLSLKDELHYFIDSYDAGLPLITPNALEELRHHGDRLVPGLIELLADDDADVRELAVDLLNEIRPRPHAAVPALIERLNDPERLVQLSVLNTIGDFGPAAAAAIPFLEPWLAYQDQYLRMLAMTTIMRINYARIDEFLPQVIAALSSDSPNVRHIAGEYLQKSNTHVPFDEAVFQEVVRRHWNYHSLSNQVAWTTEEEESGRLRFDVAPVLQEVLGGEDDGKRVWSGFEFDLYGFSLEPGIEFRDVGVMSQSIEHADAPLLGLSGQYFNQPFVLRIHLEPVVGSETREIVDTIRNEVRPIEEQS